MRVILGLLAALAVAGAARAAPLAAWVELTGAGAEARAVTDAAACPALTVDGHRRAMHERAGPTEAFATRVCEARLPKGARRASVEGVRLALPKPRPARIVVIGDTGCRLLKDTIQHCNDPLGWPFGKVAALAARQHPDVVIHLGDYYYRERACPPGEAACAGSPFGDRWPTWKAELFEPARPLLAAAPWVFARGNHEDCQRGGPGWFRLLDAAPAPQACPGGMSAPFTVDLGGLRLAVLDSANPDDRTEQPDQVAAFARDLSAIPQRPTPTWLVTHRPFWALSPNGLSFGGNWGNPSMRAAARQTGFRGAGLILSGHVHTFTAFDFGPSRPPQLVIGAGGDVLDAPELPPPFVLDLPVDGLATRAVADGEFGYFVFDRQGRDWVGTFRDLKDRAVVSCRLHAARLACVPAARNG
jgi:hypothetical protein